MKSIQLSLNEFIPRLFQRTVSNAAYSKARLKLKHTAFIELNQEAVVKTMYEPDPDTGEATYRTWVGFRILAVDGSRVILPTSPATTKFFGSRRIHTQHMAAGTYASGMASVLYDVLNHVAIDASLARGDCSEVDLAIQHMQKTQTTDLALYDRGYCGYRLLAMAAQSPAEFVVRCRLASFGAVRTMLKGEGPDDVIIRLLPNHHVRAKAEEKGETLPDQLEVRLIRVKLDNGEYEVLATSLTDQQAYPAELFKELYWLRWGVETFYGLLKTRLGLENFSGLSPEAILQDFHVAVFLSGVETILTEDARAELNQDKDRGSYPKRVNKAVAFNAIKQRAFELFLSQTDEASVLEELTQLFKTNPVLVRAHRKPLRQKPSHARSLRFWKSRKKMVF